MGKRRPLHLSDEELVELETISRSSKAERKIVERANILLLWHAGKSFIETQRALGVSQMVVNKWRKRFFDQRLDGLKDAPRSGKPPVLSAAQKTKVIQLATRDPKGEYAYWSQRRIAKEVGMSQCKVQQILKQAHVKSHKVEYWHGKSTEVEFESRILNIAGLYMSHPGNAFILSVDGKTRIQPLGQARPLLPLTADRSKRITATSKGSRIVALLMALSAHKGDDTARTEEDNNAQNFLSFLKKLYYKYPYEQLHVIVDCLTVHKPKMVTDWVTSKKRITLHCAPTYSSWLSQIEIWFNILTKDVIKGGVWRSKGLLVDQLMEYVKTFNEQASKPFEWTYTGKSLTDRY